MVKKASQLQLSKQSSSFVLVQKRDNNCQCL